MGNVYTVYMRRWSRIRGVYMRGWEWNGVCIHEEVEVELR